MKETQKMSRWSRRFANGAWLRGGWDTMPATFETGLILPVDRLMRLNPGLEYALARLYQYADGKLTRPELDAIASLAYRYDSALMTGGPEGQELLAYVRSQLKGNDRLRRYVMYLRRLVHLGNTKPPKKPKFEEIVQEREARRDQLKMSPWYGSDGYDAAGKRQRTYVGLSGFATAKPKRVKARKAPRIEAALNAIREMTSLPPEVVAGTPGYNYIPPTPGDRDIIYPPEEQSIPSPPEDSMLDEANGSGYYRF